jgi:ATP-dependent DNA helicase RecG
MANSLPELTGDRERLHFMAAPDLIEIGRSVCAFLNTFGGTLLVGAGASGRATGFASPDELADAIQRHLAEKLSPQALWSVSSEERDGVPVILIDVPQGTEPPYLYADEIYVRSAGTVKRASGQDITVLIERRHAQPIRWERLPAVGVDLDDLDVGEIRETAQQGARDRYYRFHNERDPETILEDLNLSRGGSLLNSAVVLFGRNPVHRFAQLRLRLARFSGEHEMTDSRVVEAHAFGAVGQAESFLRQHVPIASALTDKLERADTPAYPWLALREALMNALVHRDYSAFDGGVLISIYDDRIEFWNSGELPDGMTVQDLKEARISRLRNPDIAHVFWLRRLIEAFGTGAARILSQCLEAGLPEPEWRVGGGGVKLIIRSTRAAHAAPEEINSRQRAFLEGVRTGDRVTIGEYSRRFAHGVSERQARTDLSQLTSWGYLRREGKGPSTSYLRTPRRL